MNCSDQIEQAIKEAKEKWPDWVNDPMHAAGILVEEAGETLQAAHDFCYSGGSYEQMAKEAAQTGAMAIRFLDHLHEYFRKQAYINKRLDR